MLFFEYYTKYNSSPTEHQVFTSPPTERSIYFVHHHHVLPLSVFIFQEHSSVSELMLQGSPRPLRCSRTLARPRSSRGLWPDHARARRLARPLRALGLLARPLRAPTMSITSRAAPLSSDHVSETSSLAPRPMLGDCLDHGSGTSSLAPRPVLRDFVARSSTCARGLPRPRLGDFVARSSTYARGLPRPLSDHGSGTLRLDYMRQATRIQLGIFFLI